MQGFTPSLYSAQSSGLLTPARRPGVSSSGDYETAVALDGLASSVLAFRDDGRFAEASEALEKWVQMTRSQGTPGSSAGPSALSRKASLPEGVGGGGGGSCAGAGGGAASKTFSNLFARGASTVSVMSSQSEDSATIDALQERIPKLRKIVEREGNGRENLFFVAAVQKINAHGKVQTRLLLLTDHAVYNVSASGQKFKRRIPLLAITHLTASESAQQFILHVPSEYDYLFASPSRGYLPVDDAPASGPPLASLIGALQRAWALMHRMHGGGGGGQDHMLPVRQYNDASSLAQLVKTKTHSTPGDDDDD